MVTPVLWDETLTGYFYFKDDCSFFLHRPAEVIYYLLAISLYFILPSLLMPYLYGRILYVACVSYEKTKRNLSLNSKSSLRIQTKLSVMVLLVYLSFLVTFFPYFVLFVIDRLGGHSSYWHYQIAAYLINFQGMCNFITYGAVNPEFREAYRRCLQCKALCFCDKRRTCLTVSPLVN